MNTQLGRWTAAIDELYTDQAHFNRDFHAFMGMRIVIVNGCRPQINEQFPEADVALVIGANDVVNPAARTDTSSPICSTAGSRWNVRLSMSPSTSLTKVGIGMFEMLTLTGEPDSPAGTLSRTCRPDTPASRGAGGASAGGARGPQRDPLRGLDDDETRE